MRKLLITVAVLMAVFFCGAVANEKPTVQVLSAAMRPDTTLMDITYRVDDSDDATVKVRALAFVDGVRSLANVLRPTTFIEGTEANLGDAITTGVNHTLTWNVGADWNVSLGNLKFEILCRDNRGLLSFDWITIPAVGGKPELTISKDMPSSAELEDALFWQYSDFDPGLTLSNGILTGNRDEFAGLKLGADSYGCIYILKQMNFDPATSSERDYALNNARAGLTGLGVGLYATKRAYVEPSVVVWGKNATSTLSVFGRGLVNVKSISAGKYSTQPYAVALKNDGTIVVWGGGTNSAIWTNLPVGLTNATAIAVGQSNCLALKADSTVIGWGANNAGQLTIPTGLTNATAIAAGSSHSLALKADGTVIGWGLNTSGQTTIPVGLTNVTAIAAGNSHSLALRADGTVVGWGQSTYGQTTIPAGLTNVTAIAAGYSYGLALSANGTVVGWGLNTSGQTTIPAGLTNVAAIAAGYNNSMALKLDGTVIGWGGGGVSSNKLVVPTGLTNVTAIAVGRDDGFAVISKGH